MKCGIKTLGNDFPIMSACLIIVLAIGNSHIENCNKLTKLVECYSSAARSYFEVSLPDDMLEPVNMQLVKKITPTINKQFLNK